MATMGVYVPATKSTLRQYFLARRGGISAADRAERAHRVCTHLIEHDRIRSARTVVAYTALGTEVDPAPALRRLAGWGRRLYLPAWQDGGCRFLDAADGSTLAGTGAEVTVLVPGVAFDLRGVRLGRGAGWYDRILSRHPEALKVGLAFEEQITSALPREPWDVSMDLVVTDRRVLDPRNLEYGAPRGIST
jgi:5-formyltetrahydrofolate cyclo-ligase